MSSWQNHSIDERISMIQSVAQDHNIEDNAIEKDWWVTVVLKALFNTSCGKWLRWFQHANAPPAKLKNIFVKTLKRSTKI